MASLRGSKGVCETCRERCTLKLLLCWVKCNDSFVHRYCLENYNPENENIDWKCGDCAPKASKVNPARRSERIISKNDRAIKVRAKWRERLNGSTSRRRTAPPGSVCSPSSNGSLNMAICLPRSEPTEEKKSEVSNDNTLGSRERKTKRRRRLVLLEEDEDVLEEDSATVRISVSSSSSVPPSKAEYSPYLAPDNYFYARPCRDHIWRGGFGIINQGRNIINVGLLAHLSCNACSKACDAARMLPPALNIELLPRTEVWPKTFQNSPPTDYYIALYFFPESARDEKSFDSLLDDVIEHDLALKAWMDDVELLVFSSRVLPLQHWRFRKKYYLWGVFKPRQHPKSPETPKSPVTESSGGARRDVSDSKVLGVRAAYKRK